jgi:P pilus assembly chaperone PapD
MQSQAVVKFGVALVGVVSASAMLGLWSNVAQALTISPVLVELSPDRRITSITLSNPTDHPVVHRRRRPQLISFSLGGR